MISIVKIIYFTFVLYKRKSSEIVLEDRDYILYFIIFSYLRYCFVRFKELLKSSIIAFSTDINNGHIEIGG